MISTPILSGVVKVNAAPLPVSSATTMPGTSSSGGAIHPMMIAFWINGFPDIGFVNFSLAQGKEAQLKISGQYAVSLPNVSPIPVSFSISPFPTWSSLPSWLTIRTPATMQATSKSVSSSNLPIEIASAAADGARGDFELRATYIDPMTGATVVQIMTIAITADSAVTAIQSATFNPIKAPTVKLPPGGSMSSWALGVGVCSSNNTGNCGSYGVNWNSATAVKSSFTVPDWSPPSESNSTLVTYITVNAGVAFDSVLQVELCQEAAVCSGASTTNWVMGFTSAQPLNGTRGTYYNYFPGTISEGTATTLQVGYSSSYTGGWYAEIGGSTWAYASYLTHATIPSTTHLFNYNQEPFAVESYDLTGSDFNSLYMNVNPAANYYSTSTTSWETPTSAMSVINDIGTPPSEWCGSGFCSIIGTIGSSVPGVPSTFVEAGNHECSGQISSGQIWIGSSTQGYLNSCSGGTGGLNSFDSYLWG